MNKYNYKEIFRENGPSRKRSYHIDCHFSSWKQTGLDCYPASSPHGNSWRLTHQKKTQWDLICQNPAEPGKENTLVSSGCEESFVAWIEVDQRAQYESTESAINQITLQPKSL